MYVLNQAFLRQQLTMPVVIDALKAMLVLKANHPSAIQSPERLVLATNRDNPSITTGSHLSMPATVMNDSAEYTSVKLVNICPDNPAQGLPTTRASIVLSENTTGQTLALMSATFITQIRTAALSAVATEYLTSPQVASAAVIGCGGMAYEQLSAVLTVRPNVKTVYLWNRTAGKTQAFAERFTHEYPQYSVGFVHCASIAEAVAQADIINVSTRAEAGLFALSDIKSTAHINAVGAYLPTMKEVGADIIGRAAYVVVDDALGCHAEAGDLIAADADPACPWQWADMTGDLPMLASGKLDIDVGKGITVFKSVGAAYFDAAVAIRAYQLAEQGGIQSIDEL